MKLSLVLKAVVAAAAVVCLPGVAASGSGAGVSMVVGKLTSQPIGHYEFCKLNRAECSQRLPSAPPRKLTPERWAEIERVNTSVNARITPKRDKLIYGREEVWTYPVTEGDCEDFALLKRRELAAKGFSLSNLLLTVVRKPDGEGHAILTVRTADGDFVLDNLDPKVRRWNETGYVYVKRQSSRDTGRWLSIESRGDMLVGSVR
ncbi:transglutaminase-like cysteine peptidase [Pseudorhizobium pelagicum]|uniref:Transglutaminase n=1 Tax=Pseudorhizobium pelagicum TaxID=1509405 RepID=A0A922NZB4_9HYPH|nr:transglutaminase-like cysteine peptidase [Pseudorhizobium pelagicum]KEQ04103.1 transglutaminase [Pseudorhizobium pelagicum]KEQ04989.1 transglutaminase [Pseudorhizobium pelagicum]|tara:strand:- start:28973 stop:29584 length:612 start_codon:yes stop_codon:yes gene_type:complete